MEDVIGIRRSEHSDASLLDECDIALFLSWYDMAHHKRDLGGDSLLNCRPASLADEDMVRAHQLRHLIRPADEIAALVNACTRDGIVNGLAMPRDDRDVGIGQSAQMVKGFQCAARCSTWKK